MVTGVGFVVFPAVVMVVAFVLGLVMIGVDLIGAELVVADRSWWLLCVI
mgnify:CR=1 FL=1